MAEILHAQVQHTWLIIYVKKVLFCDLLFRDNTFVIDGQTDVRTDGQHIVPKTPYSIAVARQKLSLKYTHVFKRCAVLHLLKVKGGFTL